MSICLFPILFETLKAFEDSFQAKQPFHPVHTIHGVLKEIKLVNPKWNQPWLFIGRTDDEAEAPILWPCDTKCRLIGKDPHAGKDWRQEKGTTEDDMVGWHHQLNEYDFEQNLGFSVKL